MITKKLLFTTNNELGKKTVVEVPDSILGLVTGLNRVCEYRDREGNRTFGAKIEGIKFLRKEFDISLKDAKDMFEELAEYGKKVGM